MRKALSASVLVGVLVTVPVALAVEEPAESAKLGAAGTAEPKAVTAPQPSPSDGRKRYHEVSRELGELQRDLAKKHQQVLTNNEALKKEMGEIDAQIKKLNAERFGKRREVAPEAQARREKMTAVQRQLNELTHELTRKKQAATKDNKELAATLNGLDGKIAALNKEKEEAIVAAVPELKDLKEKLEKARQERTELQDQMRAKRAELSIPHGASRGESSEIDKQLLDLRKAREEKVAAASPELQALQKKVDALREEQQTLRTTIYRRPPHRKPPVRRPPQSTRSAVRPSPIAVKPSDPAPKPEGK